MRAAHRVCHIISGYFRDDARVFYRQCMSLKNHGFDVCILTNDGTPNDVQNGIQIVSCTQSPVPRWKTLLFATRYFYKYALEIDADVYQLHSPELLPLGNKLKKMGKKVVYDAHEDMPAHILEKEWLPTWSRKFLSWCFRRYMNYVFKELDQVITPHTHVVKNLVSHFGKGVLIANFPVVKGEYIPTQLDYLSRANIFCYSGTVYKYSNQQMIANAMISAPDAHYHIAGYIDKDQEQALVQAEARDRIKIFGRLNKFDLANFYRNAVAGVAIYDYKLNLGDRLGSYGTNKIFEYMEAGLPIICTDYELWKDIINRYNCGICIKPGDTASLVQAMIKIMTDKSLAFEMGRNGRRAVENEFNWSSEEKKYCQLFQKLTTLNS